VTIPAITTAPQGNYGINLLTCVRCWRRAKTYSLRTPLGPESPPEARGKWWECECGHEWPGWMPSLFFDMQADSKDSA